MNLSLRQTHDAYNPTLVAANYTNVPLNLDRIDLETPFRAFLSLGGHSGSFIIGRDRFSWGNGETGNFALSDSPDYYDFARFTGYWGNFKYTAMWVSLSTDLAPYASSPVLTAANIESANPFRDYPRNYFLHRIDFSLFDKLSIGISEGTLIGGVQPKLAFFNPMMIFHNLFNYYNASEILAVEATYTPWWYAEVYGQFSCTQIQLPYEISRYGEEASKVPNAWGFLAGVRARWPRGEGFMSRGIEFAYVNPWMYIKENPLTTYQWWRYQFSNASGSPQWVSSPLGYFTGPDLHAGAQADVLQGIEGLDGFLIVGSLCFGHGFPMVVTRGGDLSLLENAGPCSQFRRNTIASTAKRQELPNEGWAASVSVPRSVSTAPCASTEAVTTPGRPRPVYCARTFQSSLCMLSLERKPKNRPISSAI